MMCLQTVYKDKRKAKELAKLPESGYYWKTVSERSDGYYPICQRLPGYRPFKSGWNRTVAKRNGHDYRIAFHANRYIEGAKSWGGSPIRCVIKKKDIVAIGTQGGYLVVVTKRIWIPKPKKKPA